MDVETFLLKQGIRTYSYPVITEITAQIEIKIGDSLSTELGWIYGISSEVNGVLPKDQTKNLPSTAQLGDLYLNLQYGQTWYMNDLRMSNLIYNDPGTQPIVPSGARYYPVNIPYTTDLKQSIIRNPRMAADFYTMITFNYIPLKTYVELVKEGILLEKDKGIV